MTTAPTCPHCGRRIHRDNRSGVCARCSRRSTGRRHDAGPGVRLPPAARAEHQARLAAIAARVQREDPECQ